MTWLTLIAVFQVKHFLADFPLQGLYMLGKFSRKGWALPLAAHCAVHAAMTAAIVAVVHPRLALAMAALDFGIHFVMDRIKASPDLLGRFQALSKSEAVQLIALNDPAKSAPLFRDNKYFWWSLGLDQMVHHFTHYAIVWLVLQ